MIFVTVGLQMPFDRLVRAVDAWAERTGRKDIFAQIGDSAFKPKALAYTKFLSPAELRKKIADADAVVAHAGTGTIITALTFHKALLVLPRSGKLAETRNDHQIATARYFSESGRILAAFDETEFVAKLDIVELFQPRDGIAEQAAPQLLQRLREFVFHRQLRRV